jgi:hypothetical protein
MCSLLSFFITVAVLVLAAPRVLGAASPRLPALLHVSPFFDAAAPVAATIKLPNGSKPKAFSFGRGSDLFVSTLSGEVLHFDMGAADAAATRTLLATEPGIALTGIQYDPQQHALFVAGSVSGKIFVYTLTASRPYEVARRAAVALARPRGRWQAPYVNDVAIGPSHVYATDSFEPFVHMIPRFSASNWVAAADVGGTGGGATYVHLGPGFVTTSARLNANGLVFARNNTLLVSNFDQSYVAAVQLPPGGAPRAQGEAAAAVVAARLPWVKAGGKGPWRKVWADSMVMGPGADTVYLSDNFEDRCVV